MSNRAAALSGLLVGGLLAVVATAQPWWRASGAGALVTFKGTDATGGLSQALAVVALAGTGLVLTLRVRGRQVLGALLVLDGAGLIVVGALRSRPSAEAVRAKLSQITLADHYALSSTSWPWLFVAGGVLVTGGAIALLLGAARWPIRTARFQRADSASAQLPDEDPAALWKALDAGLDPTSGAPDHDTPHDADPDVHKRDARDTMGSKKANQTRQDGPE
jgi:uncharacterized membrane protein (TIGR02234 family)